MKINITVMGMILAILAVIVGPIIWFYGLNNMLGSTISLIQPTLIPIIIPTIIVGVIIAFALHSEISWLLGIGIFLGVLSIGGVVYVYSYGTDKAYAESIEFSDEQSVPGYQERAPYVLAEGVVKSNMGNLTGDGQGIDYIPDADRNYTSLVKRRGNFIGYEAVQVLRPPLMGASKDPSNCTFSDQAKKRLGGMVPGNNLKRAIRSEFGPRIRVNNDDAYAYCDGDTPMVIIPVTKMKGLYPTIDVPAGVVTYNGKDGSMDLHEDIPAEVKGPAYPLSVAQSQRESTIALGSLLDYVYSRAGYEVTSDEPVVDGHPSDPNHKNSSEMVLVNDTNGSIEYVTPLTPRGSSFSIVGLSSINTKHGKGLAPLVIHEMDIPRNANSSVEKDIRVQYSGLPWASGMSVFEVAPGQKPGGWVASIGQDRAVAFRATLDADGTITVVDHNGKKIGNGKVDGPPTGVDEQGEPDDSGTVPGGLDISKMSASEIKQLMDSLSEELVSRAGN